MTGGRSAQLLTFLAGAAYLPAAIGLLFAPRWFFDNVGHFEPFNRHYMGDTGSFLLALALGLLFAARNPVRHLLMIGLGTIASAVHALNHAYDAVVEGVTHAHWLLDFTPLLLVVAALAVAAFQASRSEMRGSRSGRTGGPAAVKQTYGSG